MSDVLKNEFGVINGVTTFWRITIYISSKVKVQDSTVQTQDSCIPPLLVLYTIMFFLFAVSRWVRIRFVQRWEILVYFGNSLNISGIVTGKTAILFYYVIVFLSDNTVCIIVKLLIVILCRGIAIFEKVY